MTFVRRHPVVTAIATVLITSVKDRGACGRTAALAAVMPRGGVNVAIKTTHS